MESATQSARWLPAAADAQASTQERARPNQEAPKEERQWVPIRSLSARHRPRILAHLLALPAQDRYMRFGHAASDALIARYTDLIDFTHDEVFGVFNRRLELIALAHLAALPGASEAEFGVSVLPRARGRGYGARLFDRAMLLARNRGVDTLVIHALTGNTAMLRIAGNAGASVEREGGDAMARLRLPPDDLRSHLDAFVEFGAAELDYNLKAHGKLVSAALHCVGDVGSRTPDTTRDGEDRATGSHPP